MFKHKLYILESLDQNERSGTDLYNDLKPLELFLDWFEIALIEIKNRIDFYFAFDEIFDELRVESKYPFIHIEMHGNPKGLLLIPSKEELKWRDFTPLITKLNIATRNNLLVTLGSCYGEYFSKSMIIGDRAPFRYLIGPRKEIGHRDIYKSYFEFFSILFREKKVDNALIYGGIITPKFTIISSELLFDSYVLIILKSLESSRLDEDVLREHKKYLNLIKSSSIDLSDNQILLFKEKIIELWMHLIDQHFEKFFMIDLFPENAEKFEIMKAYNNFMKRIQNRA